MPQACDVHAVRLHCHFRRHKLKEYEKEILAMLDQLPLEFHQGAGGGWSFLNMCVDRAARQWTDSHETVDMLVALGIGISAVSFTLPERDVWCMFPGGMPYITVNTKKDMKAGNKS